MTMPGRRLPSPRSGPRRVGARRGVWQRHEPESGRLHRRAPGAADAISARTLPGGATAGVDDASWASRVGSRRRPTPPTRPRPCRPAWPGRGSPWWRTASTDPAAAAPEVPLTAAASPFELLDFQAHALAVGAWAGATWSGAELDAVVPVPPSTGAPTTSELLAAYVGSADSPGGALLARTDGRPGPAPAGEPALPGRGPRPVRVGPGHRWRPRRCRRAQPEPEGGPARADAGPRDHGPHRTRHRGRGRDRCRPHLRRPEWLDRRDHRSHRGRPRLRRSDQRRRGRDRRHLPLVREDRGGRGEGPDRWVHGARASGDPGQSRPSSPGSPSRS